MVKHSLEEPVVDDGQTEVLDVLLELGLSYGVLPCGAVQLLDSQDGLLHLLPNVLLVFARVLDVRVVPEV